VGVVRKLLYLRGSKDVHHTEGTTMRKVLIAVMVILAVCVGTSVSWGQTASTEATWESATWETLDAVPSVWE